MNAATTYRTTRNQTIEHLRRTLAKLETAPEPAHPNWGHVGDLNRINDAVSELKALLGHVNAGVTA